MGTVVRRKLPQSRRPGASRERRLEERRRPRASSDGVVPTRRRDDERGALPGAQAASALEVTELIRVWPLRDAASRTDDARSSHDGAGARGWRECVR